MRAIFVAAQHSGQVFLLTFKNAPFEKRKALLRALEPVARATQPKNFYNLGQRL
jgi:hypothetical protein